MKTKTIKKLIAKNNLCDNDYKTQCALGYENISKGAEVVYRGEFTNLYGNWVSVAYRGRTYDVKYSDLIIREETVNILDCPEPNCLAKFKGSIVKLIGKIALVDNTLKNIDSGIWLAKTENNSIIYVDQADCSLFYIAVSSEDKPFQHNANSYW